MYFSFIQGILSVAATQFCIYTCKRTYKTKTIAADARVFVISQVVFFPNARRNFIRYALYFQLKLYISYFTFPNLYI